MHAATPERFLTVFPMSKRAIERAEMRTSKNIVGRADVTPVKTIETWREGRVDV